jgi:hypothetical protein
MHVHVCDRFCLCVSREHLGSWAVTRSRVHHGCHQISEAFRNTRQRGCLSSAQPHELIALCRQSLVRAQLCAQSSHLYIIVSQCLVRSRREQGQ